MNSNPAVPLAYDLTFTFAVVVYLVLLVWALILLFAHNKKRNATNTLAWLLLIVIVPFVGSIIFLITNNRFAREEPPL
jgi:glycopeptide antibiotics resistance protein